MIIEHFMQDILPHAALPICPGSGLTLEKEATAKVAETSVYLKGV